VRRIAPYAALAVVWAVATTVGPFSDIRVNDLYVYSVYADLMGDGRLPFIDFGFEYPPLAALPIAAGSSPFAFGALMLACSLAAQRFAAGLAGARGELVAWLLVAQPLLIGASVRTHFDAFPVALMLGGLLLVVRDHPRVGLAVLALATMAKLFPAVLVPGVLLWLVSRGRTREALGGLAAFAAVVVVLTLPFAGPGLTDLVRFHLDRPVQIESTPATVLWIAGGSHVTGTTARPDRFKSNGLAGGAAPAVQAVFAVLLLAGLLAAIPLARDDLVLSAFASVLAFVALGKVFSPQYVIWLAPFAALAWARGALLPAALTTVAIVLTQVEFPVRYLDLVGGDRFTVVVIGVRNLLLLCALAALLMRPAAGPARSRPRVAPANSG
jgi:uncharacterized membrane protein